MSKPVILTGLRANNDLHIGNYLGALLPIVDMAQQKAGNYQINLFVPDLHSFTTPIDHRKLQTATIQNLRIFAAAGLPLSHNDVYIYRQSYVPAHSELTWILNCFARFGELNRMTQYKEKVQFTKEEKAKLINKVVESLFNELKNNPQARKMLTIESIRQIAIEAIDKNEEFINKFKSERASIGLFTYPTLMAADILLYGAECVPVGDDQTQHLEFTRDIAQRLNNKFGKLFTIPKPAKEQHEFFGKDQGLRIRDLQTPTKKMSKSDESGKGVIFLSDSPRVARQKIMNAETDSLGQVRHDYDKRPGVSNLLDMLKLFDGNPDEFIGQNQYGPLKEAVADKITGFLTDFQAKLAAVDDEAIKHKLEASEKQMNETANAALLKVQKAVGLRP